MNSYGLYLHPDFGKWSEIQREYALFLEDYCMYITPGHTVSLENKKTALEFLLTGSTAAIKTTLDFWGPRVEKAASAAKGTLLSTYHSVKNPPLRKPSMVLNSRKEALSA